MKIQMKNTLFKQPALQVRGKKEEIVVRLLSLIWFVVFIQQLSKLAGAPFTFASVIKSMLFRDFPTGYGVLLIVFVVLACQLSSTLTSIYLMPFLLGSTRMNESFKRLKSSKKGNFVYNCFAGGYENAQKYTQNTLDIWEGIMFYLTSKIIVHVVHFACFISVVCFSILVASIMAYNALVIIPAVFAIIIIYICILMNYDKYKDALTNVFSKVPNHYKMLATMVFFNVVVHILSVFSHVVLHI